MLIKQTIDMRYFFFICMFVLPAIAGAQQGQKKSPVFYADLQQKEVRLDEAIEVVFIVENGQNGKFTPPDWQSAGLDVVSTNTSTSMSINNGSMKSSSQYRYYLQALHTGTIEIPAATYRQGELELFTEPLAIEVHPDESGATERPRQQMRRTETPRPAKAQPRRPTTRI